jgi:hypothetical protein
VNSPLRDATPSMRNSGLSAPDEPVCRVKSTCLRPSFWTTCALREGEMQVAFFSSRKPCPSISAQASWDPRGRRSRLKRPATMSQTGNPEEGSARPRPIRQPAVLTKSSPCRGTGRDGGRELLLGQTGLPPRKREPGSGEQPQGQFQNPKRRQTVAVCRNIYEALTTA